ncbi:MAG: ABC transporter permease [Lachnospiraceae bacterium]|nr:ABC transporter permease [Lachnospiraceae bacterium]
MSKKRGMFKQVLKRFSRNRTAMIGLIIFALILLCIIGVGIFCNYDQAIQQNMSERLMKPCAEHIFGTDQYGRDVFIRVLFGGRTSLFTALAVIACSTTLGMIFGSIAGYGTQRTDNVVMRINDVFAAIPETLLAVCIVAALGGGMFNLGIACVCTVTPGNIRMFRSWVMPLKEQDYIEAARACGTKNFRIITRHILPNCLGPILVLATLHLALTIIAIAGLSFIGLGVQSPTPEWGAMLSEAREFMRDYPHLIMIPGAAILLSALSLNMIGDGLRDALDPKLKN